MKDRVAREVELHLLGLLESHRPGHRVAQGVDRHSMSLFEIRQSEHRVAEEVDLHSMSLLEIRHSENGVAEGVHHHLLYTGIFNVQVLQAVQVRQTDQVCQTFQDFHTVRVTQTRHPKHGIAGRVYLHVINSRDPKEGVDLSVTKIEKEVDRDNGKKAEKKIGKKPWKKLRGNAEDNLKIK